MLSFTLQDIIGVSSALLIFPSVALFPGYVIGWTVDLFDFRQRQILTRHIIAILLSMAVAPIFLYLLASFVSFYAVKLVVICFFISYILIMVGEIKKSSKGCFFKLESRYPKLIFLTAAGWILLSMLLLVDLQWGKRLYNNVVSLDFATRATLINAITQTGVPPVNPSYFPGRPEYIISLYYFWYIFCSVIDQLGGDFVNSRMALIAGDIWCGLALMALIALYIRIRNSVTGESAWRMAFVGISLLAVSGLDIIPASLIMFGSRFSYGFMWPYGDIEHWNEQITAWAGSLFWVSHHVAAMIVCITGFMIFQYYRDDSLHKRISAAIVAGLTFASAVGLSVWVTVVFSLFLGVWSLILLVWHRDKRLLLLLLVAGLAALLFASPFLLGVLKGGTGGSGIPFAFEVRKFRPAIPFVDAFSPTLQSIIYLLLLPVNYLTELGFFFVVGLLWLQRYWNGGKIPSNPFLIPEVVLMCVVVFVCSFIRSTVVVSNDFGWRGWLFGQFILLIWAVDLNESILFLPNVHRFIKTNLVSKKGEIKKLLAFMLLIGLGTSAMDVALLRFWPVLVDMNVTGFPNTLSPDTRLGERTFDGRLAYEFIDEKLPEDIVVQQNPLSEVDRIDRPSGLYGSRQFAISFNAPFNVPLPVLRMRSKRISEIFIMERQNSWDAIDLLCQQYFIDVLVVNEQDPLWRNLPILYEQRAPLYKNRYYAVLPCGEFALGESYPFDSVP